jgi:4-diphosphocytidyl-2-C-methyl-D-erythritol kinase
MSAIYLRAPAKINITLEVIGPREDGYHDVSTVMQAIGVMDDLLLEKPETPAGTKQILITEPRLDITNEDNLVVRAVGMIERRLSLNCDGLRILLRKRIPISAGMGGGSSDAAAVLKGILRLYGRDVPKEEILLLARNIGTDVPFFLGCATGMGSSRGDIVTPLPNPVDQYIVVIPLESTKPDKTAWMYSLLSSKHYSRNEDRSREVVKRLQEGKPIGDCLFNTFDAIAPFAYPDYADMKESFLKSGATVVMLAGAGPSMFSVCNDRDHAFDLHRKLTSRGLKPVLAPLLRAW